MKKLRKVNVKKRKQDRKEVLKKLESQTEALMNHPKECCVCSTSFERTKETVRTWQVIVTNNKTRLTCPSCWAIVVGVTEALEENK